MQYLTKKALYRKIEQIRPQIPCIPKTIQEYRIQLCQLYPKLYIVQRSLDSKKVSGMLLRNDHSLIILNSSRWETSQRFTLTHEMIHYLLHPQVAQFFCEDNDASTYEWQANEGAAELLIPYRNFLPAVARIQPSLHMEREHALQTLADQFGVSTVVISNRLDSLSFEIDQYRGGVPLDKIQILSRNQLYANKNAELLIPCARPSSLDIFPE